MFEAHSRLLLLGASSHQPSGCSIHQQAYLYDQKSHLPVRIVVQRATILVGVDLDTFYASANMSHGFVGRISVLSNHYVRWSKNAQACKYTECI